MLFDLEDYAISGFFGAPNGHYVNNGDGQGWHFDGIAIPPVAGKQHSPYHWEDAEATFRATRDAYMKATNEYILSGLYFSAVSDKPAILAAELDIYTKFKTFLPISKNFWNALKTLAAKDAGFNEGDIIYFLTKENANNYGISGYDFEAIQNRSMEFVTFTAFLVNDSLPQSIQDSGYVYTEMTQELYDSYSAAFKAWMGAYKGLYLAVDGATFEEYVAPAIPAWDSYPELSGYVRGTNSLSIKDAVVRLVDADGVNHDVVTDVNGYYKFEKEMFYNTIAFDHGATASNFNMFVLEHTLGSTASLYDKTSIFQNSFFGAENNREFTWPVSVRMGKPARRNFKLEFLPDYSNYPSFSGYVKDAAGNPIVNALVFVKDGDSGFGIGQYIKPNGSYGINFKYNDFGVEKTILTDENGFYEYTSQMVGEWFNKELMNINGQSHLGGRTFDQYFVNPVQNYYDDYTGRYLDTNETFMTMLIPYVQDPASSSISWENGAIYDNNDYYTSRFKYALNPNNEFFYQKIELNTHYDINVDVTVAVGDEVRADKVFFELDDRSKEVNGGFNIHLNAYANQTVKIVYPKTGESYQFSGGYDSNSHLSINSTNFDDYSEFYIYACDNSGRAFGYINRLEFATNGSVFKSVDVSGLSYLRSLTIGDRFYGESIDVSGMNYLSYLSLDSIFVKNIEGLESKKLAEIEIYSAQVETLDLSKLVNLRQMWITRLPLLESLDLVHNTKLETLYIYDTNVNLNVVGLTSLNNITYNKITMTSDDVDDLLIQLADNPAKADGSFVHGNIQIYSIARSSYSDSAYDILSSRGWSFQLGSGFYPDLIEPKKMVLTIDPNLVDKYSESLYTRFNVQTSTGYWIGKSFDGGKIGYVPGYNLWDNNGIGLQYQLGIENATIEIYSCDENGIPQGDITSFELSEGFVFSDIDTSELTELTYLTFYGSGSIESLDLKLNINLEMINLSNCSTIDSIDVTGLTSLKHISVEKSSLSEVIGFSTLSSLETINIESLPNLSYLSFAGLNNIRNIYINEDDLYDSTHVDTMLSELNVNSVAGVALLDTQISTKTTERDAKQVELDAISSDLTILNDSLSTLNSDLNQLTSDGADQSLIDSKQAEIDAKQAERDAKQAELDFSYNQYQTIQSLIDSLNSERSNYFSGRQVQTYYMARTSASDADYDSLIAFGWTLNLGGEFIYPYSQPVKGFVTIDWNSNENSDDYYNFSNFFKFKSTTGYVKIKSGRYSDKFSVNSDPTSSMDAVGNYMQKGIMEFYSCDSHGRPAGSIIGFGKTGNNSSYIKSFDISNLTDILYFLFESGFSSISTMDLSSNINIKSLIITQWNSLESIVGFENLVNLKDIYIYSCLSLDIPVDFTSMVDLQRIYLYDLGVNKNSRLNVSGLTKLQNINVSWTNILSVDLDNALLALDSAGLDSEFDFNYEGHLSYLGGLNLNFGMGIGYNLESASAFTSLQSKGWSLNVGDQIIDSVEEPTKGIARWGMETGMARLYFSTKPGMDVRIKNPDGSSHGGPMINFNFDSSMPEADRFVEFWAVDNYGRPRHDGITEIEDSWNTGPTSLEVNNITSITNINIPRYKGTSLDVSGMTNLTNIQIYNSYQLESLKVEGCSKIRNLQLDGCNNLNIDKLLQDLDITGSEGNNEFGNCYVNCFSIQRTHASDAAVDSLTDKRWDVNVKEPVGTPVKFNITTDSYIDLGISTSTGNFKILWPVGTQEYDNYPDGQYFSGWQKYNSPTDFNYKWLSLGISFNSSDKITIISCDGNQNPSGEVRAINMDGNRNYNFDYSTLSKLKVFEVRSPKTNTIGQLSLLNLAKLNLFYIDQNNHPSTTLDLSNVTTKSVQIVACSWIQNIIFKSDLKGIVLEGCEDLTSISLPNNLELLSIQGSSNLDIPILPNGLKSLSFSNRSNLQTLSLPNSLTELTIYSCTNLTSIGSLPTSLKYVQLSNLPLLDNQSLDFSICTNIQNINIYQLSESLTTIDLTGIQTQQLSLNLASTHISNFIGIETTKLYYFNDSSSFVNGAYTVVLPNTVTSFTIGGMSYITSLDISVVNNEFLDNNCNISLQLNGSSLLTSIVSIPSAEYVAVYYPNGVAVAYSLPVFDERTRLYLNGFGGTSLDFGQHSLERLNLQSCQNLTTITGLTGLAYLQIQGCNSLNTDFSNFRIRNEVYIQSCSNLTAIFNADYIGIYNSENVNISGSTITGTGNIQARYNGNLNFSNITANSVETFYNAGSINLDNSHINDCFIRYNNSVNTITISNAIFDTLIIDSCQNLQTIDLSTTSAVWLQIKSNSNLLNFSFSLKGTYAVYANSNFKLTNVTFTDAAISNSRYGVGPHYIDMHDNNLFTSATVDSIINAVSLSNATNKYLQLSKLNQRTSASQTAYNKLLSQNWNFINM